MQAMLYNPAINGPKAGLWMKFAYLFLKRKRSFKRTQKGVIEEDAKSPVHFLKHCVLKVTTCPRHTKYMNTNTNALLSVVKSSCEVREIYIYEIVYKHISYYIIHYIENCIHW